MIIDDVVISRKRLITVIPAKALQRMVYRAKAGIQECSIIIKILDPARSGIFTGETTF